MNPVEKYRPNTTGNRGGSRGWVAVRLRREDGERVQKLRDVLTAAVLAGESGPPLSAVRVSRGRVTAGGVVAAALDLLEAAHGVGPAPTGLQDSPDGPPTLAGQPGPGGIRDAGDAAETAAA